jgi:4-hydroxy-tetrahydrodipicolinate synthase
MRSLPSPFGGVVPPLCTPFTESHDLDLDSLRRLIEFQLAGGVHGLFVLGSTSETVFLTDAQRTAIIETTVRAVAGRVPVVAGVLGTTTMPCIEYARAAQQAGAQGIVLTAPFYARTSQPEILEHFRQVRAAVDLPILAYDIPSAVHVMIDRATILELAREGTIAGVKDSSGDEANFRGLVMASYDLPGFATFTGSELIVDAALLFGATGVVPGLGNVDPAGYRRLYDAAQAGDWAAARREQERLYRLFQIIFAGDSTRMGGGASAYGGFKTALVLQGIIATNVVGRPQPRFNDAEVAKVRTVLVEAGIL